jgi:hypothetical protein
MIKTSILSAILMTSALLHTSEVKARVFDPLASGVKVNSGLLKDVYSGIKFHYLDRKDRMMIVNDFLNTVDLEYALLPLKEKRIGLNFKQLREDAIAAEMAAEDFTLAGSDRKNEDLRAKIAFLQASSNMDFLDRMQLLVSKFKDTHFSIGETISRPYTYMGLRLFRVDGKIVVGSIDKKFIAMVEKLSGTDFSQIKIGDQVKSIDGVEVEAKINELKPYVDSSTPEFTDMGAVRALTLRNFKYDKKNFMKIEFKNAGTYKMPLYVNNRADSTPRLDAITYFDKIKIPSDSTSIGIAFDKATGKWNDSTTMSFQGYSAYNLKENLKGVTELNDDGGSPAIRTGYFIQKGKTYAVMQLMTFSTRNVKNIVTNAEMPFLEAIRSFALDAKQNELPVILDLRVNGGGNAAFPAAVLEIFSEEKAVYGGPTRGYRVTSYMRNMEEPGYFQQVEGEDISEGLNYDDLRTIMDDALNEGKVFAPMYNTGVIRADGRVGGFEQKMVVLVTPNCVSACDMTSFLFQESKRATLIGTSSNGTGAGYRSSSELNTQWTDPLRVLTTNVPNFLFGRPGKDAEQSVYGENSVEELCSENIPAVADIQYSTTMLDVARGNLGWLQKAAQVLDSKE